MAQIPEFPTTIGPFTMSTANLARAFNSFYTQNPEIPRPDPEGNENSMAGMDPYAAGMGESDIVFCQLSPLHPITLDAETKVAANIPAAAIHFAWAYPMVMEAGTAKPRGAAEAAFFDYGGYIYFDDHRKVVGTNSITPAPYGTLGLMFGRPQPLSQTVADALTKQGRFQEISLKPLADKGATHFAWIRPREFFDDVASTDGCFAYKFANGAPKYFPVVSKPVFTKDLLEETLDANEAWAVIRGADLQPSIEIAVVFTKSGTFHENFWNNSNSVEVHGNVNEDDVRISRESNPSHQMGYKEWQASAHQGSLADPWIFEVVRSPAANSNLTAAERDRGYSGSYRPAEAAALGLMAL